MLDKIAENIGVSTEALIRVIDTIISKCPHDFGVPEDYEIMEDSDICGHECEVCWKTVIDKISTI